MSNNSYTASYFLNSLATKEDRFLIDMDESNREIDELILLNEFLVALSRGLLSKEEIPQIAREIHAKTKVIKYDKMSFDYDSNL